MDSTRLSEQVSGVAALAEPARLGLYLYVAGQDGPVSRDQAAVGVDVARHTAKFHLDKLVEQGLLDVSYKRLSGRSGPGAGRPTKLYCRSDRELSITLPERQYEFAGQLMARAIEHSAEHGTAVMDALHTAAADVGATLGARARARTGNAAGPERLAEAACIGLADLGYQPQRTGGTITMANCPFDALAREHTALVCGMNLALLEAVVRQLGGRLDACLDPADNRCCVVLQRAGQTRLEPGD